MNLGEIVTWDLPAMEVPFSTVRRALDSAALPPDTAGEMRIRTAFRRALAEYRKDNSIDAVKTADNDHVTFQLTRRSQADDRVTFDYNAQVTASLVSGDITCGNSQIEDRAREMFAHCLEHRTTSDITRMVQTLFQKNADLFPLNRKGVAYFVPEVYRGFTGRVEAFLTAMGGTLGRFPVPAAQEAKPATADSPAQPASAGGERSVKDAVEEGLRGMKAELDATIAEWDESTRKGTMDGAVEKWQQIKYKVEAYSAYLQDRKDVLLTALQETRDALAAKVADLQEKKQAAQEEEEAKAQPLFTTAAA